MPLPPPDDASTCLVTGASSGIGAELARGLARRGHGLTLTARRLGALEALAAQLRADHGVRVDVHACDLDDGGDRDRLLEAVAADGRAVEVLVNNAGFGTVGRFHEIAGQRGRSLVRVCVETPVHLCEAFVPGMVDRGRGAVLNVASIAAFQPLPGMATYAACKSFVLSFTSALHAELAPFGVTASVLAPGAVRTEFADVAGGGATAARIPAFCWSTGAQVADVALDGVEQGRAVIVPGAMYRVAAVAGHHAPRRLVLSLAGRSLRPRKAAA